MAGRHDRQSHHRLDPVAFLLQRQFVECGSRVDGPLTVCFSSHDRALSIFYPLASAAAGDNRAGAEDPLARFRAMGQLGAFGIELQPLGDVGTSYPFTAGQILNLDSSDVVIAGDSPSGAHSDIFHPQLAWVVAVGGGLNTA